MKFFNPVALLCVLLSASFLLPNTVAADEGYRFSGPLTPTSYGAAAEMSYTGSNPNAYTKLTLEAIYLSETELRLRMTPSTFANLNNITLPAPYIVPDMVFPGSEAAANTFVAFPNPRYSVEIDAQMRLIVQDTSFTPRKTLYTLMNISFQTFGVSFHNQVEADPFLFGYGEHNYYYFLNRMESNVNLSLWNTDNGTPWKNPMYGVHPIVFSADPTNQVFSGLLWLNSHAQNLQIVDHKQQTFFAVGGIIDLFIFVGDSSLDVTSQYHRAIGPSAVPPHWALGVHQCRWGYKNLSMVEEVVQRYAEAKIPLDVMWNDIDYMDQFRVFTTDPIRYPQAALQTFIHSLHEKGMKYIQITDPGVATAMDYETYTSGIAEKVFVTEEDGKTPLVNAVWPGWTVFPDFSLPRANEWWANQIAAYRHNISVDGMWLDMNELGTFCAGQCDVAPGTPWNVDWKTVNWNTFTEDICVPNNCTVVQSPFNNPPINPLQNGYELYNKTLDMTGKLAVGKYYNTKTFYGFLEVKTTYEALWNQTGLRPFIVTRASFVGAGRYTAHWTGDNSASWAPRTGGIADSIQGVLGSNLWGIPVVGADIGGFGGSSSEELVVRWYQLGVFYTFTRNHHDLQGAGQEPYLFSEAAQDVIRASLHTRYRYTPYLYSNLLHAAVAGGPVLRHLSMEFPLDLNCYTESTNFMFGPSILVAPVVEQGATSIDVYLPAATWYNATSLEVVTTTGGIHKTFPMHANVGVSYSEIPVFIRGGSIIPIHDLTFLTLNETREAGVGLIVAMNASAVRDNTTYYTAKGDVSMASDKVEIQSKSDFGTFSILASGTRATGTISSKYNNAVSPTFNFLLKRRVRFTVTFPDCDPSFATNVSQFAVMVEGQEVNHIDAVLTCNSFSFLMEAYQDGLCGFDLMWSFDGVTPAPGPSTPGDHHSGLSGRAKHAIIGGCIGGAAVIIIVVAVARWFAKKPHVDEQVPLQEGEGV